MRFCLSTAAPREAEGGRVSAAPGSGCGSVVSTSGCVEGLMTTARPAGAVRCCGCSSSLFGMRVYVTGHQSVRSSGCAPMGRLRTWYSVPRKFLTTYRVVFRCVASSRLLSGSCCECWRCLLADGLRLSRRRRRVGGLWLWIARRLIGERLSSWRPLDCGRDLPVAICCARSWSFCALDSSRRCCRSLLWPLACWSCCCRFVTVDCMLTTKLCRVSVEERCRDRRTLRRLEASVVDAGCGGACGGGCGGWIVVV